MNATSLSRRGKCLRARTFCPPHNLHSSSRIISRISNNRLNTVRASEGEDVNKPSPDGSSSQPSVPPGGEPEPSSRGDVGLQIPRQVIREMKDKVFGFDAFFVTGTENYEADGVLFKGNLRGEPSMAFAKMESRLQAQLGSKYKLFLLQDKDESPVVVVLPTEATVPPEGNAVAPLALLFAAITLITTFGAAGVPFLNAVVTGDTTGIDGETFTAAAPGAIASLVIFGAHEAGHFSAAKREGAQLAPPLLIPAGLGILGSFGTITGVQSVLRNRGELLRIAVAGPLAGTAVSAALVIAGLGLSLAGVGPSVAVETAAWNDCLLMGAIGQLAFGERLVNEASLQLSPFLLAGWAGLVINGLNTIPIGELDGGRISHAIWGRRAAARLSVILIFVIGLIGIIDSLALYWILLILTLQRGPLLPQQEELSEPEGVGLGLALLALPLLTLVPYPIDVTVSGF